MSAIVQPVTIQINGDSITLAPLKISGDNPRFYAAQVEEQLEIVAKRARVALESLFGTQFPEEDVNDNRNR